MTLRQIIQLRTAFGKLDRIDPCGEAYPKLIALLDSLDQASLYQLGQAKIKFVSVLARNRVRNGVK